MTAEQMTEVQEDECVATARDNINDALEGIAIRELGIQSLTPKNHDSLDFHEVSVWQLKSALIKAYAAGKNAK